LETIPELTGYFTRLEDLDRKREKPLNRVTKDSEKSTKNDKERTKPRGSGKGDNKPSDKNTSKYCTFHKSSTHDTSECKAKKNHDLKSNNKISQEVNVITPVTDNFCYEVSPAKESPSSKKRFITSGYDDHFLSDHHQVHVPP